jgi:hypothetical protein
VLSLRLALTIGLYNVEGAELVSSHLDVLTGTDDERHFQRLHSPSEPVIAEVSARCTKPVIRHGALKALNHYIVGGVVDAGYRGDLPTKLTCLMAMDHLLNSSEMGRSLPDQLRFSRTARVLQFLNALITPRSGNNFCEMLRGIPPLKIFRLVRSMSKNRNYRRFFNGYVQIRHCHP